MKRPKLFNIALKEQDALYILDLLKKENPNNQKLIDHFNRLIETRDYLKNKASPLALKEIDPNKVYLIKELMAIAKIELKLDTIRDWCRYGKLKASKIGKLYYIKGQDFLNLFE